MGFNQACQPGRKALSVIKNLTTEELVFFALFKRKLSRKIAEKFNFCQIFFICVRKMTQMMLLNVVLECEIANL